MKYFIADFHIHSKYSRATSREMDVENLAKWAKLKGVSLLGTGDFTHPQWYLELKSKLRPAERGIFEHNGVLFMLTAEVSNIYSKTGRSRKVHNIIFAPDFDTADEINKFLSGYGKLHADGRPILGLECDRMVKELSSINPDIAVVPAHVWTPHFSLFGSNSGFDKIEDCFGDQAGKIPALETGLSSDPGMNWRLSALDGFSLISNSDAHSPSKIGREANVFSERFTYKGLFDILRKKD
ncbi:MAG: endonuclease Q family protein, partial [Candidatus Omnitrophota bacterium]